MNKSDSESRSKISKQSLKPDEEDKAVSEEVQLQAVRGLMVTLSFLATWTLNGQDPAEVLKWLHLPECSTGRDFSLPETLTPGCPRGKCVPGDRALVLTPSMCFFPSLGPTRSNEGEATAPLLNS